MVQVDLCALTLTIRGQRPRSSPCSWLKRGLTDHSDVHVMFIDVLLKLYKLKKNVGSVLFDLKRNPEVSLNYKLVN